MFQSSSLVGGYRERERKKNTPTHTTDSWCNVDDDMWIGKKNNNNNRISTEIQCLFFCILDDRQSDERKKNEQRNFRGKKEEAEILDSE
mgnify:CR=1 FL=1